MKPARLHTHKFSEPPHRPECCPVQVDMRQVELLALDLHRTMRRLRRDLRYCPRCPAREDCAILETFNHQVDAAIGAVVAEWDLCGE